MKRLIVFLFALAYAAASHATKTSPVRAIIVDSATGAPIAGAHAVYRVTVWEGTLTGHGGKEADLFHVEATSNAKGEVLFAPTEIAEVSYGLFGMNTNYGGPVIEVKADGYWQYNWVGRIISKNLREAIQWDYNKAIEIKLQAKQPTLPQRP